MFLILEVCLKPDFYFFVGIEDLASKWRTKLNNNVARMLQWRSQWRKSQIDIFWGKMRIAAGDIWCWSYCACDVREKLNFNSTRLLYDVRELVSHEAVFLASHRSYSSALNAPKRRTSEVEMSFSRHTSSLFFTWKSPHAHRQLEQTFKAAAFPFSNWRSFLGALCLLSDSVESFVL